jgi:hypothetical protein
MSNKYHYCFFALPNIAAKIIVNISQKTPRKKKLFDKNIANHVETTKDSQDVSIINLTKPLDFRSSISIDLGCVGISNPTPHL